MHRLTDDNAVRPDDDGGMVALALALAAMGGAFIAAGLLLVALL